VPPPGLNPGYAYVAEDCYMLGSATHFLVFLSCPRLWIKLVFQHVPALTGRFYSTDCRAREGRPDVDVAPYGRRTAFSFNHKLSSRRPPSTLHGYQHDKL